MLKACVHNQLVFRYVLNDVWFASSENMTLIKTELEKDFVMPVKTNRKVALSEQDKNQGRSQAVETLAMEAGAAYMEAGAAYMEAGAAYIPLRFGWNR